MVRKFDFWTLMGKSESPFTNFVSYPLYSKLAYCTLSGGILLRRRNRAHHLSALPVVQGILFGQSEQS